MNKIFVGVDVGLSGAMGAIDQDGKYVDVWDMPLEIAHSGKHRIDAVALLHYMKQLQIIAHERGDADIQIGIEQVGAMPKQGVTSMFNFGDSFGVTRGVFAVLQFPVEFITPVKWKRVVGCVNTDKKYALTLARSTWPDAPLHLQKHIGRADALLIAKAILSK